MNKVERGRLEVEIRSEDKGGADASEDLLSRPDVHWLSNVP